MASGRPAFGDLPVALSARFYVAKARVGDLDNYMKLLLDALSGYLYADDRQVVHLADIRRFKVEGEPRTEVSAWVAEVASGLRAAA